MFYYVLKLNTCTVFGEKLCQVWIYCLTSRTCCTLWQQDVPPQSCRFRSLQVSEPWWALTVKEMWGDITVAPAEESHFTSSRWTGVVQRVRHCACAEREEGSSPSKPRRNGAQRAEKAFRMKLFNKSPPGGVHTTNQQQSVQFHLHADKTRSLYTDCHVHHSGEVMENVALAA